MPQRSFRVPNAPDFFPPNDKNALQAGLYALLCELAARASKGKSSSLRIERAEELLESAMFSLGMALKAEPTPEEALKKLKSTQIRTLFAEGQKLIGRKILICRALHKNYVNNCLTRRMCFTVPPSSTASPVFSSCMTRCSAGRSFISPPTIRRVSAGRASAALNLLKAIYSGSGRKMTFAAVSGEKCPCFSEKTCSDLCRNAHELI